MKLIEDNSGMFPGESSLIPVCSVCGCKNLFKQVPGLLARLKHCPSCNHELDWGNMNLKGSDLNGRKDNQRNDG